MAAKSANVMARVEPELKTQAENIFSNLGIPVSTAINMFYHQVVLTNGIPFRPSIPSKRPRSLEEMSKEEFDERIARGLEQAKAGQYLPLDEAFTKIDEEVYHDQI